MGDSILLDFRLYDGGVCLRSVKKMIWQSRCRFGNRYSQNGFSVTCFVYMI